MKGKTTFLAKAFLMLIAVLFSFTGAKAQTEFTLYEDATAYSGQVPVEGMWTDSYLKCEYIIAAADLVEIADGTISKMTYHLSSPASESWGLATFTVFVKEVEETTISAFTGTEGATVVYEGALDGTQPTMEIEFATPYKYNGGNLLVGVYQTVTGTYKSATFVGQTVTGACVQGHSTTSLDEIIANQKDFVPKTTFTYTPDGVVYEKPTDLTVNDLGVNEVTLSWTEPESKVDGYAYQFKVATETEWSAETTTTENSVTLTGLTKGTPYTFRVKAVYGEKTSGWISINFTTDCELATLPLEEGFDAGIGCWTVVNLSSSNASKVGISEVNGNNVFQFSSYSSSPSYDEYLITPQFDGSKVIDFEFKYANYNTKPETFKVGYSTTTKDIDAFTWGEEVVNESTSWQTWSGSFPEGTKYIAIYYYSAYQYYLYVDNLVFTENNGLFKPTDFAVSEVTSNSAKLSWTENGTATAWQICLNGDEENLVAANSNPFVLEGLTPETAYTAKVRATDGTNFGKWSEEVSFITEVAFPAPADIAASDISSTTATITWTGEAESYNIRYALPATPDWKQVGDDVTATGELTTYTYDLSGYTGTGYIAIRHYNVTDMFRLNVDNIIVTNAAGETIVSEDFESGEIPADWLNLDQDGDGNSWYAVHLEGSESDVYYYGNYCATSASYINNALTPDNWLVIPNVELGGTLTFVARGQDASWADEVFGVFVAEGEATPKWTTVTGVTSPYTIEGLNPETEYVVEVQAVYGTEGESEWASTTFTTDIAFPAPAELAVSDITGSSATISWTTSTTATGSELQYAAIPEDVPTVPTEFKYDDGTAESALGAGGSAFNYAIMFPAGTLTGHVLNSVSVFDYQTSEETITIYNDGATAPAGEAIGSKPITFTNTMDFVEVSFDNLEFDNSKSLWVVVSNNSGSNVAYGTDVLNDPNGRWLYFNGSWLDLASAGVPGAVWLIHVGIATPNYDALTYTTVDGATSPAELTGLEPNTDYIVKVRAIFGTEGTSEWTSTCFTTGSNNPVPANIAADLAADGATLTWEGEGEGYNVRYRSAAADNYLYEADFSTDLNGWTPYTLGEGPGFAVQDFNGSYSAVAYSYDNDTYTAYSADNWLVSPAIELGGTLKFTIKGDPGYPDNYEVLLSTTDAELTSFTTELQSMSATQGDFAIDLSAYAGQTGYIAFHHVSTDCFALAITNLGITEEVPAGAWTEMAVTDATATISGLATDNTYEYQIQSINGGTTSEWSEIGEFSLVTLDCDGDNEDLIAKFDGKFAHVTLANRTFYKDGTWNSIYLPFDLTEEEFNNTVLADGELRTLTSLSAEDERIKLNFDEAMGMYASDGDPDFIGGFPYIIKWATGSNVVNPEFANVTISAAQYGTSAKNEDESIEISFGGTYTAYEFDAEETSVLFIGENSKLYYPQAGAKIGATRGFFILDGVTAGESNGVKFYTNLDGDDATGIANISVKESGEWYDLSGRKLAGKPMQKGIYVNGGRKVTIK